LTEKMIIGTNNLVINEIGAVFNVRIEGDTDANLFCTDATNSRVGVGTVGPTAKLDVVGGDIRIDNGNLIIGTSGKGVDFSATSHPAGMTSELLADYEEGTWTPVPTGVVVNSGTPVWAGTYTKVGRTVTATWILTGGANITVSVGNTLSLPFTSIDAAWGVYGNNSSSAFIGGTQAGGALLYFGTAGTLVAAGGTNVYQV